MYPHRKLAHECSLQLYSSQLETGTNPNVQKPVSEKQIVVYAYNGIILGNNKGRTMKNMNESQKKHYAE